MDFLRNPKKWWISGGGWLPPPNEKIGLKNRPELKTKLFFDFVNQTKPLATHRFWSTRLISIVSKPNKVEVVVVVFCQKNLGLTFLGHGLFLDQKPNFF